MKIINLSDQDLSVNGTSVELNDFYLPNDFAGTLQIGLETLTYDNETYEIIAYNDGGGLTVTYSSIPEPPYWGVAGLLVFAVGVSLLVKLLQKIKLAR